jgi:hypothetical protein
MRWSPFLLLALLPAQARADLTATYVTPDTHRSSTVEIAANGDFRTVGGRSGRDMIFCGGEAYSIESKPNGIVVTRISDLFKVMAELNAAQAGGARITVSGVPAIARKGSFTINGRLGDAYYAVESGGRLSTRPLVVISHDPRLAPLGKVLVRLLTLPQGAAGRSQDSNVAALAAVLESGAPILSPDGELRSVSFAPIAAARFALPAPPQSLDALRKALLESAP